jgi:hypothetical protein
METSNVAISPPMPKLRHKSAPLATLTEAGVFVGCTVCCEVDFPVEEVVVAVPMTAAFVPLGCASVIAVELVVPPG